MQIRFLLFTKSALRLIQSISYDVPVSVCLSPLCIYFLKVFLLHFIKVLGQNY